MAYNPLSLTKQAILYIICNLEHFDPQRIKDLPLTLRRKVFVNLPVIDICHLEDLGVADGLAETEGGFWDEVSTQRVPRHHGYEVERNVMFESPTDDWKAYYFAIMLHVLFDHVKPSNYRSHYELVLHLLLGVPDPVDVFSWSGLHFSYFAPITSDRPLIPNRHLRYLTTRKSDIHFLTFILDTCKYDPKFIYIVCDLFGESEIYQKHATDLLTKHFGKVEKLVFAFDYDDELETFKCYSKSKNVDLPYDVPVLILKAVLASENPVLEIIEFRDIDGHMLGETLRRAGPLFYAAYSSLSNIASKHIPYCCLKEFALSLQGKKVISTDVLQKLSTIVKNQLKLEKVSLHSIVTNSVDLSDRYRLFLSSFSPVLKLSHFKQCTICSMHIPIAGACTLIEAFLSSCGQQPQALTFDRTTIVGEPTENEAPRKLSMDENSTMYKALEFFSCEFPHNFFKWLFEHPYIWLKKLAISNCSLPTSERDFYGSKHENVLHLAAVHPSFRVTSLEIAKLELIHYRHSASDFEKLLSNPSLEHFSIRAGKLGHHGLMLDITAGVKKQTELGTLKNLSLIGNQMGDVPDSELQMFLNAVFSLPQIEKMEVNLSHNDFEEYHFTMMYDTWTTFSGGKRFKYFSCSGSSFPRGKPMENTFDQIAVKCYHW